ncbi:hypothetical protein [Nocardia sp. NPDC051570]|uniref:hypothetical protein n=1 Tax=Nocardia sp. NPDC051570 TaxID=3364324 RepID=UPI00379E2BEC
MTDEQATPETTDLGVIPVSEIKPEDVGTLTLTYTDGAPSSTISGGTVVPAETLSSRKAEDGRGSAPRYLTVLVPPGHQHSR